MIAKIYSVNVAADSVVLEVRCVTCHKDFKSVTAFIFIIELAS